MKIHPNSTVAAAALCALLAACGHAPRTPDAGQTGMGNGTQGVSATGANPARSTAPLPQQRSEYSNINVYKSDAALHILQRNADHTFTGALPPMLPAIVVLRVTVDSTGKLRKVTVLRSRDDAASQVAMASMQRTAYLPMPRNLGVEAGGQLTFLETFLFNDDYRFQIRTLAPVQ
jgi:protein TonB